MTGADLAEWEVFERLHGPILLHERLDAVMASIGTAVYRAAGSKQTAKELFDALLPDWDGHRGVPDEDQLVANLRSHLKPKESPSPSPHSSSR